MTSKIFFHLLPLLTHLILPHLLAYVPSLSNVHYVLSIKLNLTAKLHLLKNTIYSLSWRSRAYRICRWLQPCPPSTICVNNIVTPNLAFSWTRQDQLLISLLISFLLYNIRPFVVGLTTS